MLIQIYFRSIPKPSCVTSLSIHVRGWISTNPLYLQHRNLHHFGQPPEPLDLLLERDVAERKRCEILWADICSVCWLPYPVFQGSCTQHSVFQNHFVHNCCPQYGHPHIIILKCSQVFKIFLFYYLVVILTTTCIITHYIVDGAGKKGWVSRFSNKQFMQNMCYI